MCKVIISPPFVTATDYDGMPSASQPPNAVVNGLLAGAGRGPLLGADETQLDAVHQTQIISEEHARRVRQRRE
jgi:hypothetical protein